jgi:hypothetical protein
LHGCVPVIGVVGGFLMADGFYIGLIPHTTDGDTGFGFSMTMHCGSGFTTQQAAAPTVARPALRPRMARLSSAGYSSGFGLLIVIIALVAAQQANQRRAMIAAAEAATAATSD